MAEVLYSWASISFARNDGSSSSPASASASAMAAAVAANGEGRTHGFDWNDGSLCSVSRSVGPLRERITSSPREIRREGQKTIRGGTRRRGSEVKWMSARRSAFVRYGMTMKIREKYPVLSRFLFDYSSLSGMFYIRDVLFMESLEVAISNW